MIVCKHVQTFPVDIGLICINLYLLLKIILFLSHIERSKMSINVNRYLKLYLLTYLHVNHRIFSFL